jgi:hypothetical protein
MGSPKMASGTIFEFKLKIRWKYEANSQLINSFYDGF